MIALTEADVTAALEAAVAKRGPDFDYGPARDEADLLAGVDTTGGCYYQHPGDPCLRCLIGEVLYALLDDEGWEFCTHEKSNSYVLRYLLDRPGVPFYFEDERVLEALATAQYVQDEQGKWGLALEAYYRHLATWKVDRRDT